MSQTGANADEWVPVKPGTEGVLALGLAHVIMRDELAAGRRRRAAPAPSIDGWSAGLPTTRRPRSNGSPASRRRGSSAWRASWPTQRPAVAVIGGAPLAHTNGLFTALAVNALNALLGSVGEPGGVSFMPQMPVGRRAGRGAGERRRDTWRPASAASPSPSGAAARRRQSGVRDAARPGRCARRCARSRSSSASAASSTRPARSRI